MMVKPNILVTGTAGVGKSRLCKEIEKLCKFKHIDVSAVAKENNFIESFDKELECPIIDEDQLLDHLEPILSSGGNILEYHSCELFPERWFHVVYVLRCDNTILYDRLKERKYNEKKLKSNIECEIFETILSEAKDSYDTDIVHELKGDSEKDFKLSVTTIRQWIKDNKK